MTEGIGYIGRRVRRVDTDPVGEMQSGIDQEGMVSVYWGTSDKLRYDERVLFSDLTLVPPEESGCAPIDEPTHLIGR